MDECPDYDNYNWVTCPIPCMWLRDDAMIYPKSMMKNFAELKPSVVFVTDDIQTTYANMKSKGVEFEGEPSEMQWGTFATFKDEDGNTFLLKG